MFVTSMSSRLEWQEGVEWRGVVDSTREAGGVDEVALPPSPDLGLISKGRESPPWFLSKGEARASQIEPERARTPRASSGDPTHSGGAGRGKGKGRRHSYKSSKEKYKVVFFLKPWVKRPPKSGNVAHGYHDISSVGVGLKF